MRFNYILIIILSIFFAQPAFAQDNTDNKSTGTLIVVVTNGTPDGHSVIGDPVTLSIYRNEKLINTLYSQVNQGSNAVFQGVPLEEETFAITQCRHEQVMFQGSDVVLKPSKSHLTSQIQVYDVSPDDSKLSVTIHHIIIKRSEGLIHVSEYMRLKNSSDMAIKPDKVDSDNNHIVLNVMLPKGYENFQSSSYFHTGSLVFTDEGFYDTMAMAPGEYDIHFSYTLNVDSETMEFARKFSLPTDDLILFTALPHAKVLGLGESSEFTMADSKVSRYYPLGSRKPGEELKFQLTGFKLPKQDRSWIIMAVIFCHIAMLVIWRLRKKRVDS